MVSNGQLCVGGRYNWIGQRERLIYLGVKHYPRNGLWHQFALVDKPTEVWCEVPTADLNRFEVSQP